MKLNKLPEWVLTGTRPAFYDTDSDSTIEQTARVYAAMKELQEECSKFTIELDKAVEEFKAGVISDQEEFKNKITKIMHDYIMKIDEKIKMQDLQINESIIYIKENLKTYIEENVSPVLEELILSGALDEKIAEVIGGALDLTNYATLEYVDNAIANASGGSELIRTYGINIPYTTSKNTRKEFIMSELVKIFNNEQKYIKDEGSFILHIADSCTLGSSFTNIYYVNNPFENVNGTASIQFNLISGLPYSVENDKSYVITHALCTYENGYITSVNDLTYNTNNQNKFLDLENTSEYTPTADYHPSTKKYVDDAIANVGGGSVEGLVVINEDNTYFNDSGELTNTTIANTLNTERANEKYILFRYRKTIGSEGSGRWRLFKSHNGSVQFEEVQSTYSIENNEPYEVLTLAVDSSGNPTGKITRTEKAHDISNQFVQVQTSNAYSEGSVMFDIPFPEGYTKDNSVVVGHNTYVSDGTNYNSKEVNVNVHLGTTGISGFVTFTGDCTGYTAYTTITLMKI